MKKGYEPSENESKDVRKKEKKKKKKKTSLGCEKDIRQ